MDRDSVIERLRAHEAELKAMGIARLSLFGSVARGEAGPKSDVDLAAEITSGRRMGLFRFEVLRERLEDLLGSPVDLLREPIDKPRLRARVDQDRVHVF
ncbi:MAG: uncharacterized protein QOE79_1135 [Sphingomonadales bacterium]|nr:uncharacterized protein [Sphingomonadales bacterium]